MEDEQVESVGREAGWIISLGYKAVPTTGAEQWGRSRATPPWSAGRTVLCSIKLRYLPKYRTNGEKKRVIFICHVIKIAQASSNMGVSGCWDLLGSWLHVPPPAAPGGWRTEGGKYPPVLCQDFSFSFISSLLWRWVWGWTAVFYISSPLGAQRYCAAGQGLRRLHGGTETAAQPEYHGLHLPGALTCHRFQQSQA